MNSHDLAPSRKTQARRYRGASVGVIAALGAGFVGIALPVTSASAATPAVTRIAGATRFDTAIAAS
ncbi:MAG TPA: hypothetical protein VN683_07500, partial [Acidothermaceae bacterium]|nr:hypothetical protein [Acidothermaceae bacterium]